MEKEDFQQQIAQRFLQIRRNLYDDNNRKMASEIGEEERILSAMCTGSRNIGLTVILKLLYTNPDIDANWLLTGRIPRASVLPCKNDEESLMAPVTDEPAEYGKLPVHHTDGCPWERYDAAQQEIGSLRERLASAASTIATLSRDNADLRKKTASPSAPTPTAPIFA